MSEPVAPCPTCPEGWRPLNKEHCPDCYEGQIERLKANIEALKEALRVIALDECSTFPIKDGWAFRCESIARAALDNMPADLSDGLPHLNRNE